MARTMDPALAPLRWPGMLLGFALGGFFDGILLHQVLQWHHLLSAVDAVRDLRAQVLFDGLFHALMYVIATVALARLWTARTAVAQRGAGRQLCGWALAGFGLWHVVDAVLSHWLLGIHRIRMDSPHPLAWDVLWLLAFGLVPAVVGRWLLGRRDGDADGGAGGAGGRRAAATLAAVAVVAATVAAVPSASDRNEMLVLFAPGVPGHQAFNALASVDARVLWADGSGGLWAVRMEDPDAASRLYRQGALFVSAAGPSFGCLSWTALRG
jgi:uncharacterized membrane protein